MLKIVFSKIAFDFDSTEHFLLHCPQFINKRGTLLCTIGNINYKLLENGYFFSYGVNFSLFCLDHNSFLKVLDLFYFFNPRQPYYFGNWQTPSFYFYVGGSNGIQTRNYLVCKPTLN